MERIHLQHTLPSVFEGRDIKSDVWLQDVTLEKGNCYLIEAASGTGKSSLCSYIIGYRQDYLGDFLFDDRNIRNFGVEEWTNIRQTSVSHLFQELRLFPELTAMENVLIKNNLTCHSSRQQIETWFDALGIGDRKDALIGRMSFGQQQRVAMIRALVQPFDFLLLDEPISHLDEGNSDVMASIMMEEAKRQGAGIVVTSIGKHMQLPYTKTLRL